MPKIATPKAAVSPSSIPSSSMMLPKIDKSEYHKILKLIKGDKQCVLVSGSAGTGKTTFIEYLCSEEGKKDLPIANLMGVVAPTGIAAMQARGATIHSFFQFPPETYDYENSRFAGGEIVEILDHKRDTFRKMELLIIDEVSMVRADIMDAIDKSMRVNRGIFDLPFGGVKLLLIGDIFQLQPVVTGDDREFLDARYQDSEGMFFFNSLALQGLMSRGRMGFVELAIPRRFINLDDKKDNFYDMLNRIRMGDTTDLNKINQWLNRRQHYEKLLENNAVMLTGRRDVAARRNNTKLAELKGELHAFEGLAEGKCKNYNDNKLPAPRNLEVKKGAQVIFVRNGPEGAWHNGSLAHIVDFHRDEEGAEYLDVKLLEDDSQVTVERETWQVMDYKYNKKNDEIESEEVGSYQQYPLMLAWAMTIHRAQGKTLSRAVINLHGGAFSAGQAYVALSRCREAKDVGLVSPLQSSDIICHPQVTNFYHQMQSSL